MSDMDEAHRRDYADKTRMRNLRVTIEAFVANPPSRAHRTTLEHLANAVADLKDDEAHVVRVWD